MAVPPVAGLARTEKKPVNATINRVNREVAEFGLKLFWSKEDAYCFFYSDDPDHWIHLVTTAAVPAPFVAALTLDQWYHAARDLYIEAGEKGLVD